MLIGLSRKFISILSMALELFVTGQVFTRHKWMFNDFEEGHGLIDLEVGRYII